MKTHELREIVMGSKEKLPAPYDQIVSLDGFDALCAIFDLMGGSNVYIPTKYSVFRKCLEEAVRREYNGSNIRALRDKYGYSESHLRKILR